MRKSICINTIVIALSSLVFGAAVFAQSTTPSETPQPDVQRPKDMRTEVLGQLGLSRDQIQRIRRVNVERKPFMEAAQTRLREANSLLDEAIYADQVNETDVQARLKDAQLAQAEVARIRFMNEFAVRRILTPEQLVRFRDLRRKFEQQRQQDVKTNRPANGQRLINRLSPGQLRDVKQEMKQVVRPNRQKP